MSVSKDEDLTSDTTADESDLSDEKESGAGEDEESFVVALAKDGPIQQIESMEETGIGSESLPTIIITLSVSPLRCHTYVETSLSP